MAYVDGFVIPIPKKNLAAYRRMARQENSFPHTTVMAVSSMGNAS